MTVIAYRDGVLACDTGVWRGDVLIGARSKIERIGPLLVGAAGRGDEIPKFHAWIERGRNDDDKPKLSRHFQGCIVEPNGKFLLYSRDLDACWCEGPFNTCGSGMEFLLGAMAAGASAREAIEYAIKYHDNAGGSVVSLNLNEVEEAPLDEFEDTEIEDTPEPEAAVDKFLREKGLA